MLKIFVSKYLPFLLMTLLLCVSYIRMVANFVIKIDFISVAIKYLLIVFVALLIMMNLKKLLVPLSIVIGVIIVILFHYTLFVENRHYIGETFVDMWPYLISIFLCGFLITSKDLTLAVKVSSYISFICGVALLTSADYFRYLTEYGYGGPGAVYSGLMLFPAVSFLFLYKWKGHKLYLLPSIVSVICIIAFGGKRMTIVCYILALIYVFFCNRKRKELLKYINVFLVLLVLVLIFYCDISHFISQKYDFDLDSTRIVDFLGGSSISDSGRSDLRNELYSALLTVQGVLLGFGVCGDYVITSSHQYSHNIILEVMIDFGLLLGGIMISYFTYVFLCAIRKYSDYKNHILLLTFVILIPLLQSGTFWNSTLFWLLFILCLRSLRSKSHKLAKL